MKNRILLIDDEPDILLVVGMVLRSEGFEIDTAESAEEGLKKIETNTFHAVVCDFLMPKMNGIDFIKQLRADNRFLPVVFLSGHADGKNKIEMMNFGAVELVQKPHIERLALALRKCLTLHNNVQDFAELGGHAMDFLRILHNADRKAS